MRSLSRSCLHSSNRIVKNSVRVLIIFCCLGASQAQESEFGGRDLYFAHAAMNSGSATTVTVHNPVSSVEISVRADFYAPDGSLRESKFTTLPALGTFPFLFEGNDAPLFTGWIHLSSENSFTATEFMDLLVTEPLPRIGVLPSTRTSEARVSGFVNRDYRSGLAIANPELIDPVQISVRLLDPRGEQQGDTATFALGPLQQRAAFLNEDLFFGTGLDEFAGSVEITSTPGEIILISLVQAQGTGNISTVAAFSPTSAGSPGFSGYEQVVESYELVDEPRFATRYFDVDCPPGKSILGGGANFSNASSNSLTLAKSYPKFSSGWAAEFQIPAEYPGSTVSALIEIYAMCAPVSP